MSVEYTFTDKFRHFFGLGPTASTAEALHNEVVAKRLSIEVAKAEKLEADAKAAAEKAVLEKPPVVKKAPAVKKPVALKKGAVDGDGDGLVQDGTTHERKAGSDKKPAAKKPAPKDKKTK